MSKILKTGRHRVVVTQCDRQSDVHGDPSYSLRFEKIENNRRYFQTRNLTFNFKFIKFIMSEIFDINPNFVNNTGYIRRYFLNKIMDIDVVENKVGDNTYYNVHKMFLNG